MSRVAQGTVVLRGRRISESEKAIKFQYTSIDGTPCEPTSTWFPISQMHSQEYRPDQKGEDELIVTEWICRTKGIV